jgi:hypothetical protein
MKIGRLIGRIGVTAALTVGATVPVMGTAAATPAEPYTPQTAFECMYYLQYWGYALTPARVNACARGSQGEFLDRFVCRVLLGVSGVDPNIAAEACRLA